MTTSSFLISPCFKPNKVAYKDLVHQAVGQLTDQAIAHWNWDASWLPKLKISIKNTNRCYGGFVNGSPVMTISSVIADFAHTRTLHFREYPRLSNHKVMGSVYFINWIEYLWIACTHEMAHVIQYTPEPGSSSVLHSEPHGQKFQTIYQGLREWLWASKGIGTTLMAASVLREVPIWAADADDIPF